MNLDTNAWLMLLVIAFVIGAMVGYMIGHIDANDERKNRK